MNEDLLSNCKFIPIDDPALISINFQYMNIILLQDCIISPLLFFLTCLVGTCNFSNSTVFIYNSSNLGRFSNCNLICMAYTSSIYGKGKVMNVQRYLWRACQFVLVSVPNSCGCLSWNRKNYYVCSLLGWKSRSSKQS